MPTWRGRGMGGRLFPKVPGSGLQRWLVTIAETDRKYQVGSGKGFLTLVMLLLPRQTSGRVSQEQGCGVCPCARGPPTCFFVPGAFPLPGAPRS